MKCYLNVIDFNGDEQSFTIYGQTRKSILDLVNGLSNQISLSKLNIIDDVKDKVVKEVDIEKVQDPLF